MITRIEANGPNPSGKTVVVKFIDRSGLGNRFFEFSAGLSVARKLGIALEWQWRDTGYRDFGLDYFGIACPEERSVHITCHSLGQGNKKIMEKVYAEVDASTDKEVGICSPFQDERCFSNVADEVRKLFRLEPLELDVPEECTPVAVQVRRGDYIKHKRLDVVTPAYFMKAMEFIRSKVVLPRFFVVSDDPAWCRRELGHLDDVTIMPNQTAIDGLRTMAACEAHIISNSTYGWWGAWLAEKGPVVVPRPWHRNGNYGPWDPVPARWHQVSVTVPETFTKLSTPKHTKAIVWPWKEDQARWQELRYSMRSVEKFFEDKECPMYIFGTRRPAWLLPNKRVTFFDAWTYEDALARGIQMADRVMWMNDDIVLLQPVGWDEVSTPLYMRPVSENFTEQLDKPQDNKWHAGVLRALADLAPACPSPLVYSTHTPYVYEREKVLKIFKEYGVYHKMPLELIYFNLFAENPVQMGWRRTHGVPFGDALYLNHTDSKLTPELKEAIKELLPDFAPWELKVKFIA